MREILFRGKRTDNGEWVKGFYCMFNGKKHLIYTGYAEVDCGDYYPDAFEIDPSTVGQYTGLTDKYGKKIFENDIVKIKGKTRYIFYGCSGFRHTNYGEYADTLENVFTDVDCEVIGNKFDNPELLKEREQA